MMPGDSGEQETAPVDQWPNRRIIFLLVIGAAIFYAVFRLPATLGYVLDRARSTLILLILAVALAYFLLPLVDLLVRSRWPRSEKARRSAAALVAIVLFTVLLVALIAVVVTPVAEQFGILLKSLTEWASEDMAQQINGFIDGLLSNIPEPYRSQAERELEKVQQQFSATALTRTLRQWSGAILEWHLNLITTVLSSGGYLLALLIVPVFAYYFLTDATDIREATAAQIPPDARARYHRMVRDMDIVIRGYVKTVMVISVITGVATALTLYFAGVRVWLTFGILAGVANMVPVVGGIVAVVMIAGISLLMVGLGKTAIILVVYGAIQVVTDRVLAPQMMGESARLHPVAVIIALLVGAEFFGMIGVFMAVPVLAALRVAWIHYRAYMSDEGHSRELDELLGRQRPPSLGGEADDDLVEPGVPAGEPERSDGAVTSGDEGPDDDA